MNIEELEEALEEIFPNGYSLQTDKKGRLVILTNLTQDEDGELIDEEESDSEDSEFDPDTEPFDEEDLEEDE